MEPYSKTQCDFGSTFHGPAVSVHPYPPRSHTPDNNHLLPHIIFVFHPVLIFDCSLMCSNSYKYI